MSIIGGKCHILGFFTEWAKTLSRLGQHGEGGGREGVSPRDGGIRTAMKHLCILTGQRLALPPGGSPLCSLCPLPQPRRPSVLSSFISLTSGTLLGLSHSFHKDFWNGWEHPSKHNKKQPCADLLGSCASIHDVGVSVATVSTAGEAEKKETWCDNTSIQET